MKIKHGRLRICAVIAFCLILLAACAKNPDGSYTIGLPTSSEQLKALFQDPSLIHPGTYYGPGTLELKQVQTGKYSINITLPANRTQPKLTFNVIGYQDKNEIYVVGALYSNPNIDPKLAITNSTEILRQISPTTVQFIYRGEKAKIHTNVNPRLAEIFTTYQKR